IDAVQDPAGPYLCLPRIIDIRSDITTKALDEKGWAVTIDEQQENFKVQDLERKIFTPNRNRAMCAAFLQHAQKDPAGQIGKSIIFAVNQTHATALTKILNELQPNSAVTITSRIPEASSIAKEFRDGKRPERVAVSVDMLSTGYNCRDLLNVALMRPIFSPTEYIQIKGRGTRLYTFKLNGWEFPKKVFYLLDFCGVAEYFEDKYDYSVPLKLPRPRRVQPIDEATANRTVGETQPVDQYETEVAAEVNRDAGQPPDLPVWEGRDTIIFEEVRIVGPNGEKVDVMTFRGSFERDLHDLAQRDVAFKQAVDAEDDDAIETILNERFFHRPEMFYSPDKLIKSYGVPAPTPAFVYSALNQKPLPTKERLVGDLVDSVAARFNLRYNDTKWLTATLSLIADDASALQRFMAGDMTLFTSTQFRLLGGPAALTRFAEREAVFEVVRQSPLVRQSQLGNAPAG
ncbi:MAG TPA: helicase-related protein, partial [Anaerolineae bacterium]|nr:helicase-related protein [Anaerolineae bacterium]